MRFAIFILSVCVLGSVVAHPGWLSSLSSAVSDTTGAVTRTAIGAVKATSSTAVKAAKATTNTAVNAAKATTNTAVNAAKATTNTAVNAAKATTNTAVNAAKATTNVALNAAGAAKNITVRTAMAGVNLVKDASMAVINTGIGVLIKQVKNVVRKTGMNVIKIPDVAQKLGPINFNATKGYFKDVTTLTQSGSPKIKPSGASLEIDFPLKLEEIDVGYEQFNVTFWKFNMGGGIRIRIQNDTFIVHLRLTPGITCALNVERVEVAELSGYEIDFINVSKASEWVLEKSSNLIINALKGNVKAKVQEAIDSTIKKALKEDSTICSKFLG